MHGDCRCFVCPDCHFLVGRQDIVRRCLVVYLGHGIFADTQAVNHDFSVLIGGKGLVIILSNDTEREALHFAVRRCLNNFE